jgi:Family of unknown function (DUF6521)
VPSSALNEAEIVQNGALGASLIWRFGLGYQEESGSEAMPFPLAFLVLPICLHSKTVATILGTRKASGLALFTAKLAQEREDLLAVHERALALRSLSFESLAVGIRAGLSAVDYVGATIRSNTVREPPVNERVKPLWTAADRLGHWCFGLKLAHVATLLKVDF